MPRPNILLITTDQQRYHTLSCLGAPNRTPNLDRLAERGMLFERCYNQNPVCIPSRAALQTGRYPHQNGVRYMENEIDTTPGLSPNEWAFHERLGASGYHTAAFGKIHMMPDRGFDEMQVTGGKGQRWTQVSGQDIGPAPLGPQYAAWLESREPGSYERIYEQRRRPEYKANRGALVHPLPASEHVDSWIGDNTVDFLERDHDRPWFCWCGFTGPHGPLDVPPEYVDRYDPDEMEFPSTWSLDLRDRFPYRSRRPQVDSLEERAKVRLWRAYYYALMDLIDDHVGRIVEVLDRRELWDDTLVMFTSDHGEMAGDFGLWGKGNFYEVVTRVPTIVVPPGGRVAQPRYEGLVEMFDLAPTALDYAEVPIPETMAAASLRPALERGEADPAGAGRDAVFCEYVANNQRRSGVMARTLEHKLCLWIDHEPGSHEVTARGGELYDLVEDPDELYNRYDDAALAEVRRELTERIVERWMAVDCPPPPRDWRTPSEALS